MKVSRNFFISIIAHWDMFWFSKENTITLEVVRIGLGITLCFLYLPLSQQDIIYFYSNSGPFPLDALFFRERQPYIQSIFYYINDLHLMMAIYYFFILSIFCFLLGIKTSFFKWVCLIFHVSYIHKNTVAFYGVDNILCNLLIILCFGPIGKAISVDHIINRYKKLKKGLNKITQEAGFISACACTRLLQIQMAVCFFYAGIKKLKGDPWWSGEALWYALINFEFANMPLTFFSENMWLINILCYLTLMLEISYPFLIWNKTLRPIMLGGAIMLHLGIAIFMGLYLFAYTMIIGHLSFVDRLTWIFLFKKIGSYFPRMEIIYDGNCGMCLNVINKIASLDVAKQLKLRNFRAHPYPKLSEEQQNNDLFIVTQKGNFISGYKAYKYLVVHMPFLWVLIPIFHLPFLSNFFGEKIYRWIAVRRSTFSTCKL